MIRHLKHLLAARSGVAAVETGVVLAFLMTPLISILVGAGQGMLLQHRVDRALHSGLMYAWSLPGASASTSAVVSAAQDGYGSAPPTMTAVATYACYCIDSAGTRSGATAVACTSTCSTNGQVLARYVTLTTADTYTPIFTMNWGSAAWNVSATGTVRVPN